MIPPSLWGYKVREDRISDSVALVQRSISTLYINESTQSRTHTIRFRQLTCHAVDLLYIVCTQHLKIAMSDCKVVCALARHLLDFLVSDVTTYKFVDIDGHANSMVETLHSLNTLHGCSLWIGKIILYSHHIDRKTYKATDVFFHYIACQT